MTAAPSLSPDPRFVLHSVPSAAGDFAADVRRGLTARRKWLPPIWFYDQLGSSLFDTICFLPEYYVMRAEAEALTANIDAIADALAMPARLVELGSGAARKTRILLDALTARRRELEYVPVDVDPAMLERTARDLLADYPDLRVSAICADFTRPSVALATLVEDRQSCLSPAPRQAGLPVLHRDPRGRTVVLFLGSTIGNLDPDDAAAMLRDLRTALHPGDALFLGVDLKKDRAVLEPAYNDALGVTASFNLNLLQRINRELGGHFDLAQFAHHAFYDATHGRIEMHLVSRRAQTIRIDALALDIAFEAGESIHTESSYKHDEQTIAALASRSGFSARRVWRDGRNWFADVMLIAN